jgi:hypothetical protein
MRGGANGGTEFAKLPNQIIKQEDTACSENTVSLRQSLLQFRDVVAG